MSVAADWQGEPEFVLGSFGNVAFAYSGDRLVLARVRDAKPAIGDSREHRAQMAERNRVIKAARRAAKIASRLAKQRLTRAGVV